MDVKQIKKLASDMLISVSTSDGEITDEFIICLNQVVELDESEFKMFYSCFRDLIKVLILSRL